MDIFLIIPMAMCALAYSNYKDRGNFQYYNSRGNEWLESFCGAAFSMLSVVICLAAMIW